MNAEPPPNNQYRCEARRAGKKPFEFATPDGEAARAMCDAHGWEFIRIYQPGKDADRKPQAAKGDHPLSPKQIQAIAIEAGKAWRIQRDCGLTDALENAWRQYQVQALVKRDGLRSCQDSQYKKLLHHFKTLNGSAHGETSFQTTHQSNEGGDTLARREQLLALLANELGQHARRVENPLTEQEMKCACYASTKGGVINEAYLLAIARAKNPGVTLHDSGCLLVLTSAKLEHLHSTLRNRIASREGRGDPAKRNKGQRKKGGEG